MVFELYARLCRCCLPEVVGATLWIPGAPVEEEPQVCPVTRPDLAERFRLILTSTKPALIRQSQRRSLPKRLTRERSGSDKTLQLRG